jgi:hypothetical protein
LTEWAAGPILLAMTAPLASSLEEARASALAFAPAALTSPALAGRMAYHRAWVAVRTQGKNGKEAGKASAKADAGWTYAPARWAGFRGGLGELDAEAYLALGDALDGRRSDAALAAWFAPVGDPRRQAKHMRRLRALFARLGAGAAPNARTRILEVAVPEDGRGDGRAEADGRLLDLLEAVYRGLPTSAQAAFRKRIL